MPQTKQHMELVVDEYGAVSGAVFLEDVLEQIVGVVQDEFDVEKPDLMEESPGQYLAAGRMPIDQINRELSHSLPRDDVETLSGLLMTRLGRIPQVGDQVDLDGVAAEVTETHGPRAFRVRLTLAPQSGERPPGK